MTTNSTADGMLDDDFLLEFELSEDDCQIDNGIDEPLDPCPICGNPEVEWESGLCANCNGLFNAAAAVQVLGVSND